MLIADFHVHIYPGYNLGAFLAAAWQNLTRHVGASEQETRVGLFLSERRDCHFFRDAGDGRVEMPAGWRVQAGAEPGVLELVGPANENIWLFGGRQVVTSERLEILAWLIDDELEDGLSFAELQQQVLEAGGVPVLPWALGKWMFARAQLVANIVARSQPASLVLADSALRPRGWPEPPAMKRARQLGFTVVAGTDPLPAEGEEPVVGSFGSALAPGIDEARPVSSCRELFLGGSPSVSMVGRRGGPFKVWSRMRRLATS